MIEWTVREGSSVKPRALAKTGRVGWLVVAQGGEGAGVVEVESNVRVIGFRWDVGWPWAGTGRGCGRRKGEKFKKGAFSAVFRAKKTRNCSLESHFLA